MKIMINGFTDGSFDFYTGGTNFDRLKTEEDTDSADSFSSSEAYLCTLQFEDGKGHFSVNGLIIVEDLGVKVISEKEFKYEIQSLLRGAPLKNINFVRINCSAFILSQIIQILADQNKGRL